MLHAKNPPALKELLAQGVNLVPFPEDVMRAARDVTREKLAEIAGKNATFRKIHEPWSAFQENSNRWFATAEKAYGDFAFGT